MNRRNVLQLAAVAPVAALLPAVPVPTERIFLVAWPNPQWKIDTRIVDASKGIMEVDLTFLPPTVVEITVQP